ncbi:hypothetical protein [Bacillus atrophaeus]|uniref:hypothetical protein n=1 Tax=Bacillus atrophaeus TaxID=1452 RepID=UPI002E241924|nr:hypothetical protein [Bacillus atrophaeus]
MYSPINIKRSSNVNGIVTEPLNELEIKLTETFLYIPENILLKIYLNVLKGESFALIKGILRRMRVDGYLRPVEDHKYSEIVSDLKKAKE